VETQTRFLVRGLNILVVIVGLGVALMTFDPVQQLGVSLLASAGIGGIVLGFAARPVLENLLAGMQIALTEPFRIDDVLHVQGNWCWGGGGHGNLCGPADLGPAAHRDAPAMVHRDPFENWTRHSADLMGVFFSGWITPCRLSPCARAFSRLLEQSGKWDRKTQTVQVIEAGERAMQVRFLMSASDSSTLWDLRCAVREGLVHFMQRERVSCLPATYAGRTDGIERAE